MISKSPQNVALLEDEGQFTQNMSEKPKNLSFDKIKSEHPPTYETPQIEEEESGASVIDRLSKTSKSKKNCENNESEVNEFQSDTRIELSFSVDRLLNDKLQQKKRCPTRATHSGVHIHHQLSEKCCDELNSSYSCCSLPNCLINASCQGNSYQTKDADVTSASTVTFMDFKSVVRPTPVRAMGNSSESVASLTHFSSLPTPSLIRFHHAHVHPDKPLTPQHCAPSNFPLSSVMNPFGGLKSLQMNTTQRMGLPSFQTPAANRFNTKLSFDIPQMRANLGCITSLRHHRLAAAISNESPHLNFNNNTASASPANTAITSNSSTNSQANVGGGKRKRSWSRAVFSNLQRKGLEIQFQQQKYITKPDRRKLAARLNLTDAQVKVWFQNRRMKWRHTRENLKSGQEKQPEGTSSSAIAKGNADTSADGVTDLPGYSSDGSSSVELSDNVEDEDEIDVVE